MRNQAIEYDDLLLLDAPEERTSNSTSNSTSMPMYTHRIDDNSKSDEDCNNDDAEETETPIHPKTMNFMKATEDDEAKLQGKLAPEPPRWRFVREAKSTLGYSSVYAGSYIKGKSSAELGAKFIAPEIIEKVKVKTIEHFDRAVPDEKVLEQKKEKEVGKLSFTSPKYTSDEFNGEFSKRKLFSTMNYEDDTSLQSIDPSSYTPFYTYNLPPDDSQSDFDRSLASTGQGSNENVKSISLQSIPGRRHYWKRYRWMLPPLLILLIIISAAVGKKRSSEGNDSSSIMPERFVFGESVKTTWLPSQYPTFSPTDQPSLIPSFIQLPTSYPSTLPSAAPSEGPSSKPTTKPSKTPSFDPTLMPSINPTLGPSVLPSGRPSATPTQPPSVSISPTTMRSDEPSLSLKPSPSPSRRPSSYPSSYPSSDPSSYPSSYPSSHPSIYPSPHPITMTPSKQPIMFMGGCPEPFQPFTSYIIDQRVSRNGVIYVCISTNCGSLLQAPGLDSGQWQEDWKVVGSCDGTIAPTSTASAVPSIMATETPSTLPTLAPLDSTVTPSANPTHSPSIAPSPNPTRQPSVVPSVNPTHSPSKAPSPKPTRQPSVVPTANPTPSPNKAPSPNPTRQLSLSASQTRKPTGKPVVAPSPKPTCPPQNGDFNICLAIDMSGSVCGGGWCSFCQPLSRCNSFGINQQRCCNNFDNVLEFSKALVRALGDLQTEQEFSLVHFASDAEIASTLQNANQAIKTLQKLHYTGGSTNLAGGITLCQQTLDSSAAGRKNLMVVVTDGEPLLPERPREAAVKAATTVKNKGTFVIPIFIERTNSNGPAVALMKEISSDGQVFLTDFDTILSLKDIVFEQVICHASSKL